MVRVTVEPWATEEPAGADCSSTVSVGSSSESRTATLKLKRTSSARSAFSASARDMPTTSGTVTRPVDTCNCTGLSFSTDVPPAGSVDITTFSGTVALFAVLTTPTLKPASRSELRALSRDWPTRSLGTSTFAGPSETVTATVEPAAT